MNCAMCINTKNYNVFCDADDIMLTSLTFKGLQILLLTNTYHHTALKRMHILVKYMHIFI